MNLDCDLSDLDRDLSYLDRDLSDLDLIWPVCGIILRLPHHGDLYTLVF